MSDDFMRGRIHEIPVINPMRGLKIGFINYCFRFGITIVILIDKNQQGDEAIFVEWGMEKFEYVC